MRIAVIGAGVSGLTCAHLLDPTHEVVLFEADPRAGGHVHTVDFTEGERPVPVDTGFIVFNQRTYPRFVALLRRLGVAWAPSEMSFSVQGSDGLEYSSGAPFAQRRNLARPAHWRMLADITRFYGDARDLLTTPRDPLLGDWLAERRYGDAFVRNHLLPLVGAVWSINRDGAARMPARFVLRFFDNHDFLRLTGRTPWLTIPGGARTYVRAILAGLRGEIRLGAPVRRVERPGGGVLVDGEPFDHAILACHADQALGLLADPSPVERDILSAFAYQPNPAVLHTDASVMPRARSAWAAWNYDLADRNAAGARVTYWMNRLQPLGCETDLFVTLNRTDDVSAGSVVRRMDYAHPIVTAAGLAAQERHPELVSHRATSYCGAYWGDGFHEDGVRSALAACAPFGVGL